jgi:ATP-binding protein involved in chromosome partitioning
MEQVREKLSDIVNPNSGKTLLEEKRWKSIQEESGKLKISYLSEGMNSAQKRNLEDQIISKLESDWSEENIVVKPYSQEASNQPQTKEQPQSKPAPLKTGHGQIGPKKRVPSIKNIIAISSCKGGVGKSTVTTNLAVSLKNAGYKVGVIDADIYGPSIPHLLGATKQKPIADDNNKILPIEINGLKFISFGLFIDEGEPVIWRGPMLGGVLNQFLFDTNWGELDYLLLDLPPGTGDVQLSIAQNCELDGVLVVTTPQVISTIDVKKGLKMFEKVSVPILGIIENMSYFIPDDSDKKYFLFGNGGGQALSTELGVDFLGGIPMEVELREGSDEGKPYMSNNSYEGRHVWKAFVELSQKVDRIFTDGDSKEDKGLFSRIFKR